MRVQWAWLEFHEGNWHLLTDVTHDHSQASHKWSDENTALDELAAEGWKIAGEYPNRVSDMLGIRQVCQGYGLIRTVH